MNDLRKKLIALIMAMAITVSLTPSLGLAYAEDESADAPAAAVAEEAADQEDYPEQEDTEQQDANAGLPEETAQIIEEDPAEDEPVITDVMQDNPAADAGISAGDILMRYGNWTFDQVLSDPEDWQTELQSEVAKGRENEKRITVLYTAEDGREANSPVPGFGFIDVSFEPGLVGIEIGSIDIPSETYRYLSDILHQYADAHIR